MLDFITLFQLCYANTHQRLFIVEPPSLKIPVIESEERSTDVNPDFPPLPEGVLSEGLSFDFKACFMGCPPESNLKLAFMFYKSEIEDKFLPGIFGCKISYKRRKNKHIDLGVLEKKFEIDVYIDEAKGDSNRLNCISYKVSIKSLTTSAIRTSSDVKREIKSLLQAFGILDTEMKGTYFRFGMRVIMENSKRFDAYTDWFELRWNFRKDKIIIVYQEKCQKNF
ncbi:hypothetical protein CDIK_3457 [Cucumispora dikerogammari]|nr:hypothetical protein CDIK_3457 [Cucumispora dikerogammari]